MNLMEDFRTACIIGNVEKVKELLNNASFDPNIQNFFGETPFFIACQNQH